VVDVGLTLDFRNPPTRFRDWSSLWADNLWLLCEAEAMGFDRLLVQEHLFSDDGYAPSAPVFLTLLAERTRHIRLGSYVYVLPLRNPVHLAQECAVLDHVSGGRLEVGVGVGHRALEYAVCGIDPRSRGRRMEECLSILDLAWSGRPFSFDGEHYSFGEIVVTPTPLQQPRPPLWAAATTVPTAERAGRHGCHLAAATVDPAVFDAYRAARAAAGLDPATARLAQGWSITTTYEDPEAVWSRHEDLYFYRWDYYRRIRQELGHDDLGFGLTPSASAYRANELIGDPDTILATLEPFVRELGLTDLVVFGPAAGVDLRTEGHDSVRRFAETVLPTLKSW
jgi:alkanesulfonate monooxygenase SsuD/methylene tetrahydromethanopterin reductase-like flavin-dependent oxidoreductase (luciferase family)